MTKKKPETHERILHENLEDIMAEGFASYAKSIIQERALPDARDGLKPVQRRILYAMYEAGNTFDKPYHKSAKTVGNVIGNYHPHGDSSVYEAMVRLSQDWKIRLPLVDMQGNNGSIDDDPAAAMRYTEARLSQISNYMLKDIEKDTVEWVLNFSDEKYEPTVLPARFPNLLIHGISGIAAGYATNIPPHNLNEVVNATIYRIQHPDCSLDDLMHFVKGPDFPTGGIVMGEEGIRQAFATGRGKVMIRSKVEVKQTRTVKQLIVTEIPYEVVKSAMVKKIDEIRLNKKIDGILDVRDESDRTGLRVVIDLKRDANDEQILNYLYKNTDLQISYTYNTIAIVDKAPVQMSLAQCLDAFIAHREDVVLRRSRFELKRKKARAHILEGLIRAVSIMDEIIKIIRASKNKTDAKNNLILRFDFTEEQAEAIVTMRLYRLTNTDVKELRTEFAALQKEIKQLEAIVADKDVLHRVIIDEMKEINETFQTPRRTQVEAEFKEIVIDEKAMIADEQVVVTITRDGYVKRVSMRSFNASQGTPTGHKDGDAVLCYGPASTLDTLLLLTDRGNYAYLSVYELEEAKWKDLGSHLSNYLKIDGTEKMIKACLVKSFEPSIQIIMASKYGMIKRMRLSDLEVSRHNKAMVCMKIGKLDAMVQVQFSDRPDDLVMMAGVSGFALQYPVSEVARSTARTKGVKAMNLQKGDTIADFCLAAPETEQILVINTQAQMKRMKADEIAKIHRPGKGSRLCKLVKSNPSQICRLLPVTDQEIQMMADDEELTFKARDISMMPASSTFSTPFGKHENVTVIEPLICVSNGQWPAEEEEVAQQTLFR
ncbi:MAG: DNA topoisomerase IV subunit A [Catenisphaera adipataccumulans]|jgi:topoisomerase-4 subunit A|uniref:DNA topoisomerase IV subunit A n=1 Tax=Catenisphaera adipataccumulans TaxID=700500 RepID=UPI003D8E658A